jgi:hypothetical protein
VLADARIIALFNGDFLEADDLITRSDVKGPSGAVFKNVTEKRAAANVLWKRMTIARALNVSSIASSPAGSAMLIALSASLSSS